MSARHEGELSENSMDFSDRGAPARRTITVRICECGADARADFASCADRYCQRRAGEGSSYEDDAGKPGRDY